MTTALPKGSSPDPTDRVKVYIAGPYSVGDQCVNVHQMIQVANQLFDAGFIPFVPLLTHLWHTMTPRPYDDWLSLDLAFLATCDVLLRIPGMSPGADIEEAAARKHQIPVFHSFEEMVNAVRPIKSAVVTQLQHPRHLHCVT